MHLRKRTGLFSLFTLLQIGVNITIFAGTALHLYNKNPMAVCLIGDKPESAMYCNFTYITAGIGIGLCILVYIFQAIDRTFTNAFKSVLLCILSSVYAGAGAILTTTSLDGDTLGLPEKQWRTSIWALIWVDLGLTLLMAAVSTAFSEKKLLRNNNNNNNNIP
jgi:hypothetical protein